MTGQCDKDVETKNLERLVHDADTTVATSPGVVLLT
jgi:hypothetical protein